MNVQEIFLYLNGGDAENESYIYILVCLLLEDEIVGTIHKYCLLAISINESTNENE